jgi:hypothetical protein
MSGEEIFNQVTGLNFSGEGEVFLSHIQKFYKEKQNDINVPVDESTIESETKEFNFDFHFKKSLKMRSQAADLLDSDSIQEAELSSDSN